MNIKTTFLNELMLIVAPCRKIIPAFEFDCEGNINIDGLSNHKTVKETIDKVEKFVEGHEFFINEYKIRFYFSHFNGLKFVFKSFDGSVLCLMPHQLDADTSPCKLFNKINVIEKLSK